ncbi:imm11 family protein [Bradyrhizobium manausense]|nr:DUF1629 domain-containing protein [Bradyrhizobium manausense]MBR0723797.1 hypothetical protein [Bradyrhizobium manausense]
MTFLKCETRPLSRKAAADCWLYDVIRVLDAIDEEKTRGQILNDGAGCKHYNGIGKLSLVFKEEAVGLAQDVLNLR